MTLGLFRWIGRWFTAWCDGWACLARVGPDHVPGVGIWKSLGVELRGGWPGFADERIGLSATLENLPRGLHSKAELSVPMWFSELLGDSALIDGPQQIEGLTPFERGRNQRDFSRSKRISPVTFASLSARPQARAIGANTDATSSTADLCVLSSMSFQALNASLNCAKLSSADLRASINAARVKLGGVGSRFQLNSLVGI